MRKEECVEFGCLEQAQPYSVFCAWHTLLHDCEDEYYNGNDSFDRAVLRHLGLPENYKPRDEAEAYRLVVSALED